MNPIIHDPSYINSRSGRRRRRQVSVLKQKPLWRLSSDYLFVFLLLASNRNHGQSHVDARDLETMDPTFQFSFSGTAIFDLSSAPTGILEESPVPTFYPSLEPHSATLAATTTRPTITPSSETGIPSYAPTIDLESWEPHSATLVATTTRPTITPSSEKTRITSYAPTVDLDFRQDSEGPEVPVDWFTYTPTEDDVEPPELNTGAPNPTPRPVHSPTLALPPVAAPTRAFPAPPSQMDASKTDEPTAEQTEESTAVPLVTDPPTLAPTMYTKTPRPASDPNIVLTPVPTMRYTDNRQDTPGPVGNVPIPTDSPTPFPTYPLISTEAPTFSFVPVPLETEEPNEFTPSPIEVPQEAPTDKPVPYPTTAAPIAVLPEAPTDEPSPYPTTAPEPLGKPPTDQPIVSLTPLPTNNPTPLPTTYPTSYPTFMPTPFPTTPPVPWPTPLPTTKQPAVANPTFMPTPVPTTPPLPWPTPLPTTIQPALANPTFMPTPFPTTPPVPWPTPLPTTKQPTPMPTGIPSSPPTTASTIFASSTTTTPKPSVSADPSASPTDLASPDLLPTSPTLLPSSLPPTTLSEAPSLSLQNEGERVVMTLLYSDVLEGLSIITWEQITATHIRQKIINYGVQPPMDDLRVWTNIVRQTPQPGSPASAPTTGVRTRRSMQETASGNVPLKLSFDTAMSYRSTGQNHDIKGLIALAFDTQEDRDEYVNSLRRTGDGAFENLNEVVSVSVGGIYIVEQEEAQVTESQDMTIFIIIGAVAGGGALFLLIIFFFWRRHVTKKHGSTGKTEAVSAPYETNAKGVTTEIVVEHNPDDISTLGDPMFAPNGMAMGMNNVEREEERTASVGDDYDYKYLRHHNNKGDAARDRMMSEDAFSRLISDGSTTRESSAKTGSQSKLKMSESIFSDDTSFEEQYAEAEQQVPFEITAPAGKLGMVIDTPYGGFPIVHAIKETSVLADRVRVGDRLVSVDGQDCTSMTALQVSKLISLKSDQDARVLVFVRTRVPGP